MFSVENIVLLLWAESYNTKKFRNLLLNDHSLAFRYRDCAAASSPHPAGATETAQRELCHVE